MDGMAQLLKLEDYISRYEMNPFHYPSQYIRLKRDNWNKVYSKWEKENEQERFFHEMGHSFQEQSSFKWNPFQKKDIPFEEEFIPFQRQLPRTKEELIRYFLDKLFPFQMKWATSTVSQISFIDSKYNDDQVLKYFLQRLPDIYLLMYYPVFLVKKAPIEGEIILISPIGLEIISLMNERSDATIVVGDDRTWAIETEDETKRIISPIIALKRTEQIVKSILNKNNLDFPIKKKIISQTSNFLYVEEPYNVRLIGQLQYEGWLKEKRMFSSPLKHEQLRVVEVLLAHCQTTSVRRPHWVEDDQSLSVLDDF